MSLLFYRRFNWKDSHDAGAEALAIQNYLSRKKQEQPETVTFQAPEKLIARKQVLETRVEKLKERQAQPDYLAEAARVSELITKIEKAIEILEQAIDDEFFMLVIN